MSKIPPQDRLEVLTINSNATNYTQYHWEDSPVSQAPDQVIVAEDFVKEQGQLGADGVMDSVLVSSPAQNKTAEIFVDKGDVNRIFAAKWRLYAQAEIASRTCSEASLTEDCDPAKIRQEVKKQRPWGPIKESLRYFNLKT
ncbi:MAG: hypothetical protein KDK66_04845, partial [Deltaproteobacteria bacterium]|nr:hypothetical protein [Deltaproteobacteria bacterium]